MHWARGSCEDCDRIINPLFRLCIPCKRVNDKKKAAVKKARDAELLALTQARKHAGLCCDYDNELDDLSETKCSYCLAYDLCIANSNKRKAVAAAQAASMVKVTPIDDVSYRIMGALKIYQS